jgi:LPXTG-motif cell wall-anchored protein
MSNRFRFASLGLVVMLIAFVVAPLALADEWNKETIVRFSRPVEVPGQVLPAGKYIFKLVDSQSDRHIVQIFSEDRTKLLATVLANPDYRLEPTDKTVISMEERPSGSPEALGSWFYPGDNYGSRFVYPTERMTLATNSQPKPQPASSATEKNIASVPPAESYTTPTESSLVQNQDQQVAAQHAPAPVQVAENAPAMLPKTSSNFLILPLVGVGLLGGGFLLLRYAGQLS